MSEPRSTAPLGVTRQQFLANVRKALGRSPRAAAAKTPPAPPAVDESLVRLATAQDDLLELFSQRAAAIGMSVHPCPAAQLPRLVAELLEKLKIRSVAFAAGNLPQLIGLPDALRRRGLTVLDWRASAGLGAQYDLDAGLTDVHAALAETGTLVCCADAGHSRGLSLVPPIHVAIVRRSDILPDMLDYWAKMRRSGIAPPSSQVFITGPSKTSDIEGILITGVHGPTQVHVLLVPDA